jgi:hypothetical protein
MVEKEVGLRCIRDATGFFVLKVVESKHRTVWSGGRFLEELEVNLALDQSSALRVGSSHFRHGSVR